MLALGTSLFARGHEVLVLPPPDFAEAALAQGMEFRAVGTSVRAYLTAHARARVAGPLKALRQGARRYVRTCIEAQFRCLPLTLENETLSERARELGARLQARRHPECGLEKLLEHQEDDAPDRR